MAISFGSRGHGDYGVIKSTFQFASLQCLSAVRPMRTKLHRTDGPAVEWASPVPFGGVSYADLERRDRVPDARHGVSSAFRRWVLCGLWSTLLKLKSERAASPVPFGGGSYADQTWLARHPEALAVSPVPFGGVSYADRLSG